MISCGGTPKESKPAVAQAVAQIVTVNASDTAISKQLRVDVLNSLRVLVKSELGIDVKFFVQNLHKGNDWVLIAARPVNLDGSAVDYTKTKYYEKNKEWMDDAFDDQVVALLHLKDGKWEVVEFSIGATDYSGQAWLEEHKIDGYFK